MPNPFEDESGVYHVLLNDEGQHSLWPTFVDTPVGWTVVHKSDTRAACLEFINKNWTDMRPRTLIEKMEQLEKEQTIRHTPGTRGDPTAP
jgi:MbtH protein